MCFPYPSNNNYALRKTNNIIKETLKLKKITLRILAAIIIATMFLTLAAGCRSDEDGTDYVYVPEFITLPEGISDVQNLTYSDSKLFFTTWFILDEVSWEVENRIYSMNIDGSNVTQLNFSQRTHPNPDAQGWSAINFINVDPSGALWVNESGSFYIDHTPEDFNWDDWDPSMNFHEDLGSFTELRKIDSTTGAEILSIDLSHAGGENFYPNTFTMDGSGNIYLGGYVTNMNQMNPGDYVEPKNEVVILDSEGNFLFSVESDEWIESLFRLNDGSIAILSYGSSADGRWQQVMKRIDLDAKAWAEPEELPDNIGWGLMPGGGDYLLFYRQGNSLFGINAETREVSRILGWVDSGILPGGIQNIIILPDGRILCSNYNYSMTGRTSMEIILLTKTPYSQLPVRTELTFATIWVQHEIASVILDFNRTSQTHRIKINDYSEFDIEGDWNAGLTRLTTDIISGNIPDLLDLNGLPFHQYVARDILVDIYPFIDSDPEINRSDFIEGAFRAAQTGNGLYRVFPSFAVQTLIGNPQVVGPNTGWTIDEFISVLNANPQADMPMGQYLTRSNFLLMNVILNLDQYINWSTGEVSFDTPGFASLLEFSTRFPNEFDYGGGDDEWFEEDTLISMGRQIIAQAWLSGFSSVQDYIRKFGGDIVFKGFPVENGSGNSISLQSSIAMTSSVSDRDGAWQFLRTFLTEDWQRDNISWMFPTNKAVFDEMAKVAMTPVDEDEDSPGFWGRDIVIGPGMPWGPSEPLTQADVNQIMALIDSVSGAFDYEETLTNLIMEGVEDFFNGRGTAQDAARVLQNRVSIYISEQR